MVPGNTTANKYYNKYRPPTALTYTGSPCIHFTQNATITTITPTVTGTVTSCSASPAPTGLGINNTTCAIKELQP